MSSNLVVRGRGVEVQVQGKVAVPLAAFSLGLLLGLVIANSK